MQRSSRRSRKSECSWEPPGRDDALPPPGEGAVNEQDAFAATRAGDIRVGVVRHGAAVWADEGDHELVGSQHVGHALSWVGRCTSLQPTELSASTKKSGPELA
jgi:hypothetical protein